MKRLLPPLDLLRGFEAAARHVSITMAAKELFLTQSAVSRQIQSLEEHFGTPLFTRKHRAITLTEAGQTLYKTTATALRMLEETALQLQDRSTAKSVTVTCTLGFATFWLVPRLAELREEHPDIDLRISANNTILDVEREHIELAIRYCPSALAPAGAIRLFGEEAFPVCAPSLLSNPKKPLKTPEDLRHHVLLHFQDDANRRPTTAWPMWLEAVGAPTLKPAGSLRFSQSDQILLAAVEGQGIALGTTPLVQRLIDAGRLVAPFEQRLASPRAYYLISAPLGAQRREVADVATWIKKKAGASAL